MADKLDGLLAVILCSLFFCLGYTVCYLTIDKYQFERIADDVAGRYEYNETLDFMCGNFTDALVEELRANGYTAWRTVKKVNFNGDIGDHAWTRVIIDIESVTGEILTPAKLNRSYNVSSNV